jgi:hypothetical protein
MDTTCKLMTVVILTGIFKTNILVICYIDIVLVKWNKQFETVTITNKQCFFSTVFLKLT